MVSDGHSWEPLLAELAELRARLAGLEREAAQDGAPGAQRDHSPPTAEAEYRFEQVIENMPVILDAFDESGVIVAWNREAERVTGYSAEEIIGNPRAMEWLYPEASYRESMIRQWRERGNDYRDWEWELTAKDGTVRRVSWSNLSDRFPVPGWKTWGIGIDVTEREQALAHLRTLTERTRRILETTQDGYILANGEATIIDVNPAYCKMMGYAREELLGRNVRELDAHLGPEGVLDVAREVLGKGTHRIQTRHRRRDGELVDLDVSFTAFFAGSTPLVAAFARDISELRRSEIALKRMNRALQTYSECNSALIHAVDERSFLERICRILTEVGGYALAWVGFARDDDQKTVGCVAASGEHVDYLEGLEISWADDDRGRGPTGRAIRTGVVQVAQDLAKHPDYDPWRASARQRGYEASIALPLTVRERTFGALNVYSGQPLAFDEAEVRLLSDLAADLAFGIVRLREKEEQRRLEAQLHHAQKMETIGTLAGGIAHDFNNLLQAIIGYADLAATALPLNHPAATEIGQVMAAAGRAKKLVQQILTFGRRAETRRRTVDLRPIVEDALALLRAAVPATIEIRSFLAEECAPILVDPDQIHQVVMNICTNACQAMGGGGGTLEVRLGPATTREERASWPVPPPKGSWVCFSIGDTGPGIEEEILERIFDPFFTTKMVGHGTGLGLSVVHGIVTAHGGHIEVASQQGKGTTFLVCLPATEQAAAERSKPSTETPAGSERILYVDDEEQVATLVKKMLEHLGYTVTACTDSEEALELLRSDPAAFDMVVTDQIMPRLSGTDLARRIRESREDLPIILLTGFGDLLPREKLRECGVETALLKPVTAFDLGRAVRAILDRRSDH